MDNHKDCEDCAWYVHHKAWKAIPYCTVVADDKFARGCPGCTFEPRYHEPKENFREYPEGECDE